MPKLSIALLILFICLLILGLNIGETTNILNSGTSICLSCIGVG
jgi:flagellar biosynthesis component FlhA